MKNVSVEEARKIKEFCNSCDDMINGKFILADVKISNILKSIAQSKELYNLMAECLLNFNFDEEFRKAKTSNLGEKHFKMPDADYKRIALTFCFMVEVDNKKIEFYDFISNYFRSEDAPGSEYMIFAKTMLVTFKNDVVNKFNLDNAKVETALTKTSVSLSDKLIRKLQEIKNLSDINPKVKDRNKEVISIYVKALIEAIKIGNKRIISALAMAFDAVMRKVKPLRGLYEEFTALLIKIY